MIIIASIDEIANLPIQFEIDEYVPISFRSYAGLLGAKYLRIGNFETTLLEFLLDPHSYTIRGMTLLSFERKHFPNHVSEISETVGLPILDLEKSDLIDFLETRQMEIACDFSVALAHDYLEIDLFGIADTDNVILYDRICFLLRGKSLVGIRFTNLNSKEKSILEGHLLSVGER